MSNGTTFRAFCCLKQSFLKKSTGQSNIRFTWSGSGTLYTSQTAIKKAGYYIFEYKLNGSKTWSKYQLNGSTLIPPTITSITLAHASATSFEARVIAYTNRTSNKGLDNKTKPSNTVLGVTNCVPVKAPSTPTPTPKPAARPPLCPTGATYYRKICNEFNVVFFYCNSSNSTVVSKCKDYYSYLRIAFSHSGYLAKIKNPDKNIDSTIGIYQKNTLHPLNSIAWAGTLNTSIYLYLGFNNSNSDHDRRYVLIHELAHAVNSAVYANETNDYTYNNNLPNSSLQNGLYAAYLKDTRCHGSNGIIKTYPQSALPNNVSAAWSKKAETFADAVADTLLCGSGWCNNGGPGVSDFPKTCRNTYNYITNNVLK